MAYQFPPDVEKLMREHMASGSYISEDEVLRDALQILGEFVHSKAEVDEEYRQTVDAVSEGIADVNAGRLHPLRMIFNDVGSERSSENK
jgi:Arc/MetJ-type ribon-helix-helix transcriptional regulator